MVGAFSLRKTEIGFVAFAQGKASICNAIFVTRRGLGGAFVGLSLRPPCGLFNQSRRMVGSRQTTVFPTLESPQAPLPYDNEE